MKATQKCKRCGAEFSSNSNLDNCPTCLMDLALETESNSSSSLGDRARAFGEYEIIRQIGHGGMGIVFMARRMGDETKVALKVLREEIVTPRVEKRFFQEVQTAASLDHPNIIPIHDMGEVDGQCYFSMKLIEGTTLDREIGEKGYRPLGSSDDQFPTRETQEAIVKLVIRIAQAIHHAHRNKIIHRDLKPSNILLNHQGEAFLTDFGLAKFIEEEGRKGESTERSRLTESGEIMGTLEYMSPEQASGKNRKLTSATDIYSLGIVLYKMLTGRTPFSKGLTAVEIIKQVIEKIPDDPRQLNEHLDRDLACICLKCLEKLPDHRYVSALALAEDLERWLRHEPVLARPPGLVRRANYWAKSHPISAVTMAFLVCLLSVVSVMLWQIGEKHKHLKRASIAQRNLSESLVRASISKRNWLESLEKVWTDTNANVWNFTSDQIAAWNDKLPDDNPSGVKPLTLTFAVYAWRRPIQMLNIFAPVLGHLEDELTRRLPIPTRINFRVYRTYAAGQQALAEGDVAFARLSPATYVEVKEKNPGISILLMENGKGGGCIFVDGQSHASHLSDLKGHVLGFVDDSSTGGNFLPKSMLLKAGLSAKDFIKRGTNYLGSHDLVVQAVRNGMVFAGGANRTLVENLIKAGVDLVILEGRSLEVGKPWVASEKVDANLANAIRLGLHSITNVEVLKALGNQTTGFEPAHDINFNHVRLIMRASKKFDDYSDAESEFKLALDPIGYSNLVASLERQGYDLKGSMFQTNHYFDTPSRDLKQAGINLRLRIKGDAAKVTVKFNPTRAQVLDGGAADIADNLEYEAVFKDGLVTANKILSGELNLLTAATEALCPKTEKSDHHPIAFLKDQVLPGKRSSLYQATTNRTNHPIRLEDISKQAENATLRKRFAFVAAGMELNLDMDKTFFPNAYLGYEMELEIPSDSDLQSQDQIRKEIEALFEKSGVPYKKSKVGKSATTFIVLRGTEVDVAELQDYGQIHKNPSP